MSKKNFEVKCDKTVYQFELMKAKKALRIGFKLNSLLLPTIGATVDGLKTGGKEEAKTTFKDAALTIVMKLEELDVENLIEELFEECTINGDEFEFDDQFQGKLDELVLCLEKVLKENFSSLFTGKTKDILGKVTNLI